MSVSTVVDIADAIESALVDGDSTGVVTSYRSLDVSGKASVRKSLRDGIASAVRDLDLDRARGFQAMLDAIAAPSAKVTPDVDWNTLVATRLATLRSAVSEIEAGLVTLPEGASVDWESIDMLVPGVTASSDEVTTLTTFGSSCPP